MIIGPKHYNPAITITGKGRITDLKTILPKFGKTLIIHGKSFSSQQQYRVLQYDVAQESDFYEYKGQEPTTKDIRDVLQVIKSKEYACITGIGGGSVLDVAKAGAGLANAKNDPQYYMNGEVETSGIPFIAIPTTAGSGAEATINAVIINEKTREKQSIRDESFLAEIVILDPELLNGCPKKIIAHSGLDAISQAIESYFSKGSTWLTENLALKGFELLIKNIEPAYQNTNEFEKYIAHYRDIMTGSYLTGIALTNSRLGVIHGLAHPLGSYYNQPHGLVCALCIIPALEINKEHAPEKYNKLSEICGADLIRQIDYLIRHLGIQNVFKGTQILNKQETIDYTLKSGSTASNPKKITTEDVNIMLAKIFKA